MKLCECAGTAIKVRSHGATVCRRCKSSWINPLRLHEGTTCPSCGKQGRELRDGNREVVARTCWCGEWWIEARGDAEQAFRFHRELLSSEGLRVVSR